MSPTPMEGGPASADGTVPGRLKLLFFLPSIDHYRVFESLVVALLTAGHQVLLALDGDKGRAPADQAHPLDALREQHQGFACRELGPRKGLGAWRGIVGHEGGLEHVGGPSAFRGGKGRVGEHHDSTSR